MAPAGTPVSLGVPTATRVNPAIQLFGLCCAHLDGEGRQRPSRNRRRDRLPTSCPRLPGRRAASCSRQTCRSCSERRPAPGDVTGLGIDFFLVHRSAAGSYWSVETLRIARLAESSNDIHLSAHGERVELFLRLGNGAAVDQRYPPGSSRALIVEEQAGSHRPESPLPPLPLPRHVGLSGA